MKSGNRLLAAIGSMKLTLMILAVFAVAIAAATFIESSVGTTGARVLVYNARWFELLLAMLVVNLTVSLLIHMPYTIRQTGFVITHIGFIVVLVSAGITRYFGYEGSMPIREGATTDYMYSVRDHITLAHGDAMASFPVRLYRSGPTGIHHRLTVDGHRYMVAVEEFWPHFETRVVERPGGEPVVVLSASGIGDRVILRQGESVQANGVTVLFVDSLPPASQGSAPYGELVVTLEGETVRLDVPREPPAEVDVGGYRVHITQIAPDFRVGATPSPDDPMNNPAIRVRIEGPDGPAQERVLFAYHPDFDMGHQGSERVDLPLALRYRYERNVYLMRQGEGLEIRADFAVEVEDHSTGHEAREIAPGTVFAVAAGSRIRGGDFAIIPTEVWASGAEAPVNSTDTNRPPAVSVSVTAETGERTEVILERGLTGKPIDVGGVPLLAGYGPVRIELPYSLHLDDFVLTTYPGSDNPASFESHVRLFDEARGVNGVPVRIYMNHPLDYRGFKHFQSSYDRDRKGTVLSVNHDPGKVPTYLGYTLIGIGFLVTLTRGAWYRKRSE